MYNKAIHNLTILITHSFRAEHQYFQAELEKHNFM